MPLNRMHSGLANSRLLAGFVLLLVGCSDGNNVPIPNVNACGSTTDLSNVGPLVAIATSTYSPDLSMRTDTIQFADNLTKTGKVEPSRTIELTTTNSTLWPSARLGEMFVADAGSGTVIKYGLGPDGTLEEKGKIGFGAHGVTSFYWTLIVHANSTKSYLFDEKTLHGFVWNPDCMTITSVVELADKFKPVEGGTTYTVWRERQVLEVGGKYFAAYQYFDPATTNMLSRSGMLVIDPADDSFSVVEHPDCGGLSNSVLGPDGMIYSVSGIIAAGAHYLGAAGSACLARFDPVKMQWDETYHPDLAALMGGKKFVGALFKNKTNPDAPAYMRVLMDSVVPATLENPYTIAGAPLWQTYALDDLTNPTQLTDTGIAPAGGLIYPIDIDGKTYVSDASLQMGKSWLVDLSVDPPAHALEVSGWGFFAVKLH